METLVVVVFVVAFEVEVLVLVLVVVVVAERRSGGSVSVCCVPHNAPRRYPT